jgi:ribosomal protein S12 methylthiotransferase accessory factor YcaO
MLGADRPPYGALGFGCHATEAQALQKALAEARHVRAHMVMLASEGRRPQRRPAVGLEAALHRAAFDRPVAARFNAAMDAASPQDPWPLRRLAHRDVLWRNLTTPEVRSMGLEVVRAVFSPALGKPPPMPDSGWPPQLG